MNLADPGSLKAFLARHGLLARKRLGQHFLCSAEVVESIVAATRACNGVLEIGPGPGVLTGPLSQIADRVIALELDPRMVVALAESAPRAAVIEGDALREDLAALLERLPRPRAVVSNLPYYITGPLLTRIAEAKAGWDKAILMMQAEVGERVVAGPGTPARGSLSVFLQAQFEIEAVARAPAEAFLPPPKVDSVVLAFEPRPSVLSADEQTALFRLVRTAFRMPRKTLVNNLKTGFGLGRERALAILASGGLAERARPQELSLDQWIGLSAAVKSAEQ
ncbi:MAG: ribosomal RNA small subunit methyltransferase A [Fimbriimonas ginsengisoli]|uniref:Ribosomal RNA small subunit methyltransferase A n=1 Tax=Fimbriimonas ginsengisoli TaxID=1005039 RepID=A0A931LU41_FIMGI|nr:ribosomal RNA small subunit methyltransferase A [Fimbriimonas ginsengisoli]